MTVHFTPMHSSCSCKTHHEAEKSHDAYTCQWVEGLEFIISTYDGYKDYSTCAWKIGSQHHQESIKMIFAHDVQPTHPSCKRKPTHPIA